MITQRLLVNRLVLAVDKYAAPYRCFHLALPTGQYEVSVVSRARVHHGRCHSIDEYVIDSVLKEFAQYAITVKRTHFNQHTPTDVITFVVPLIDSVDQVPNLNIFNEEFQ